jgi:hypothetical protein
MLHYGLLFSTETSVMRDTPTMEVHGGYLCHSGHLCGGHLCHGGSWRIPLPWRFMEESSTMGVYGGLLHHEGAQNITQFFWNDVLGTANRPDEDRTRIRRRTHSIAITTSRRIQ